MGTPPQPPSRDEVRRSRLVILAVSALLVIAGITVALAGGADATTIGGFLIGVAAILLIGRVFYEIGISEDRERARGRS
jgi:uncharacterized Zn-binding protein involved in type VI secretion